MKTDLTYIEQGLFTCFIPQTPEGETAWRELAKQTDDTGKVFTHTLKATLANLRRAGYSVSKQKPVKADFAKLLEGLGI